MLAPPPPSPFSPPSSGVSHVDATGARTFGSLVTALSSRGVGMLVAGVGPGAAATRRLLAAHGVHLVAGPHGGGGVGVDKMEGGPGGAQGVGPATLEFPTLRAAVVYSEGVYLGMARARGLLPPPRERVTLDALLREHAREVGAAGWLLCVPCRVLLWRWRWPPICHAALRSLLLWADIGCGCVGVQVPLDAGEAARLVGALQPYTHRVTFVQGDTLLAVGQEVGELYLVETGVVQVDAHPQQHQQQRPQLTKQVRRDVMVSVPTTSARTDTAPGSGTEHRPPRPSNQATGMLTAGGHQYGPGCFISAHEFWLGYPASAQAHIASPTATLTVIGRSQLSHLVHHQPGAAALLQFVALRSVCLALSAEQDVGASTMRLV